MRIAISGSHDTGKSTLVALLAERLTRHAVVEELYYTLLEEGQVFPAAPTPEDYELMLERSTAVVSGETRRDVVFDRCPADYLAYLGVTTRDIATLRDWFGPVRAAIDALDLVVFVPIEEPDRVSRDAIDAPRLRRRVDLWLRELLIDNSLRGRVNVIEVSGSPTERADQVVARVLERPASRDEPSASA